MANKNKLVRDKIPDLIRAEGDIPEIEVLGKEDFAEKLAEKLLEECQEVNQAREKVEKTEELADLLEVMTAIANLNKISMLEINRVRLKKREARGAFKERILLKGKTKIKEK